MKCSKLIIAGAIFLIVVDINAQLYMSLDENEINVSGTQKSSSYLFPWIGGLNSCQFNEIDLNFDGIMDLFVFDRYGDRIITFINEGIADSICYQYAPEYADMFPDLHDWVIFADYNLDGKQDIFTYSKGFAGILVYKNTSVADVLNFELMVYPFLTSWQGGGYTNILVTYADWPAITDLDGDGDLDILTFWGLGSFVEMHKNLSMEKHGVPDSLDYEETQVCWGYFAENDESNVIYLDTCVGKRWQIANFDRKMPHTGSTFLVNDLDGDGVKDLLLGDVDYPTVVKLMNGGTSEDAFMISQTFDFPAGSKKVDLYSMPVMAYLDVNNNGVKDLIVSPFDPGIYTSENFNSVWMYENAGTNDNPDFFFKTDRFLQNETIDVGSAAYPVLQDLTADGLEDLVIGNFGFYDSSWMDEWLILHSSYTSRITVFENVGTYETPAYQLIDYDLANASQLELTGLIPAFGDLDGDGDTDMLLGNENGTLIYFENTAGTTNPAEFEYREDLYQGINVGAYSAPQLIDLDRDGLPDLVIGEKKGNLNYYRNAGDVYNPVFTYVTDSLGKVNVTDYNISYDGFSVPYFFERNDKYELIVGSEQGKIFYFKDIEGNLGGKFIESDSLFALVDTVPMRIDEGLRSAAIISDIDHNGRLDMIAGNYAGGLRYYNGIDPNVSPGVKPSIDEDVVCDIFPNPVKDVLHIQIKKYPDHSFVYIRVIDIKGKPVQEFSSSKTGTLFLNVAELVSGIYFAEIMLVKSQGKEVGLFSRKFVKE